MKNCTSCGAALQPHWKFCTNCQAPQPAQQDSGTAAPADPDASRTAGSGDQNEQPTQRFEQPAAGPTDSQPTQRFEQPTPWPTDSQPTQRFEQPPAQAGASTPTTSVFDPPVVAPTGAYATGGSFAQHAPGQGAGASANPGGYGPGNGNNFTGPGNGANNNGNGPAGPGVPPSGSETPKKPNRKVIILVVVLAILLALGIGAYFFVQNIVRGGAGSPEAAADKLLESIESKDVVSLVGLVPPNEREPLQRLQEHVEEKMDEFGIQDAMDKVGRGEEENEDELTFDGVDITFTDVAPEITEIDENTALIKYTEGEVRVQMDPDATNGQLRSLLDASGDAGEEKIDETTKLSELGPDGSALTLVATKRDGSWYISPTYSVVEMVNQSEDYGHGSVPDSAGGSNSPAEAAQAMVESLPEVMDKGSVEPLAGTLSVHEGGLLYLYGEMFDSVLEGVAGEELNVSDVRFSEGETDGDRASAVVENITLESGYGDEITVTKDCIEGETDSDSFCLSGSGYSSNASPEMFGGVKEFSLTTVKEDGKWRVSMEDTVVDWMIRWSDSLTREQALALMQLASSEDPSGDIVPDEATEVEFNSAGYAVLSLSLDEDMELAAEDEYEFGTITVYSEDGKEEISTLGYGDEIPAGDYKLVVFAGYEWDGEFAENGSDTNYSKELTLTEDDGYSSSTSPTSPKSPSTTPSPSASPSTAPDAPEDSAYGLLMPGETMSHDMAASDGESEAVVTVMGSSTSPIVIGVTLDGQEHKLDIAQGGRGELPIPYPNDGKGHTMTVRMIDGGDGSMMLSYNISIERK
ncbi:hypothetical protein [Arthrobacter sp. zg-Y750]|uniref:hypothetical protein n=1 Tax=Arthrobacter sp. zg-Y750 TaxID=2894189 RepID=UPI001E64F7D1|nr:hypothetical protein [Arthrobacter sp. zg-Y750]MCC9178299.1 hypothetical protein [Arthrobacter sp. zg-Y750]